jgi:hypothetical protein
MPDSEELDEEEEILQEEDETLQEEEETPQEEDELIPEPSVSIPPLIIKRVMSEVGFPVISFEDLGITEQDALELFLLPAMELYFAYYPLKIKTTTRVGSHYEVPFPSENVYGITQARIVRGASNNGSIEEVVKFNSLRPWRSLASVGAVGGLSGRSDAYYTQSVRMMMDSAQRSTINYYRAGNYELDREERVLKGFTSIAGDLVVTWAASSEKWKDVKFEHVEDVVSLGKAYALRFFGLLRAQADPNTGVARNGESFTSRADALEEKIIEKWQLSTKVVVLV